MSIENIIKGLENKLIALEAKKKVSLDKGSLELFNVFDREYTETQLDLHLVKKAVEQINYYQKQEVKDKLKEYLLKELPNLAFYFKESSIQSVVSDSLEKAFGKLIDEYFSNKIVELTGEK